MYSIKIWKSQLIGCGSEMKLVNIVLAIFRPNMGFLEKLLDSLNNQIYSEIVIIIRDDSEDETIHCQISKMIKDRIRNFNYVIYKNAKNIGSNKTFELLTKEANGDYIAYCDQDDIWDKEKIFKLVNSIEKEGAVLCYSDLSIIDGNDKLIAKSFKDINKRVEHVYGVDLFKYFLRRKSVTGCTMLIKSDIAQKAIPFCDYYVHDHWLTLWASIEGKIAYVKEPLVKYRIHDNNQIGASMLDGINNKEEYIIKKLIKEKEKYEYLLKKYNFDNIQRQEIMQSGEWIGKKIDFFKRKNLKNTIFIISGFREDWQLVTLEMLINFAPKGIVERVFRRMHQ